MSAIRAITLLAFLLLLFIIHGIPLIFPGWHLRNGSIHLSFQVAFAMLFSGLILFGIASFKILAIAKWILSGIVVVATLLIILLKLYPLDTMTERFDKAILKKFPTGQKVMIRKYKNAKANQPHNDTVLVRDIWIYRKIY